MNEYHKTNHNNQLTHYFHVLMGTWAPTLAKNNQVFGILIYQDYDRLDQCSYLDAALNVLAMHNVPADRVEIHCAYVSDAITTILPIDLGTARHSTYYTSVEFHKLLFADDHNSEVTQMRALINDLPAMGFAVVNSAYQGFSAAVYPVLNIDKSSRRYDLIIDYPRSKIITATNGPQHQNFTIDLREFWKVKPYYNSAGDCLLMGTNTWLRDREERGMYDLLSTRGQHIMRIQRTAS